MLSTAFVIENRKSLCHSLGRPSRSDFVQLEFVNQSEKFTEESIDYKKQFEESAVAGGSAMGTFGTVNKLFEEEKFHARQGHGFAAERANNLYDKITRHDAKILGDNNALNGADRIVDGMEIQSKYCKTGSRCINECF